MINKNAIRRALANGQLYLYDDGWATCSKWAIRKELLTIDVPRRNGSPVHKMFTKYAQTGLYMHARPLFVLPARNPLLTMSVFETQRASFYVAAARECLEIFSGAKLFAFPAISKRASYPAFIGNRLENQTALCATSFLSHLHTDQVLAAIKFIDQLCDEFAEARIN